MTDSHCHLDLCKDPSEAVDPSLRAIITIGTTLERSKRSLELAERFANVFAAVGIHPNEAEDASEASARRATEALALHPKVVAIGETGFDQYWDKVSLQAQHDRFLWHAELAARLDKPLILHVRDKQNQESAALAAVRALRQVAWPKGILHCFSGHPALLEVGLELGWMISFAGNLSYKSAQPLRDLAADIPGERLLVETDSPYLTPEPKRGQRNRPANVRLTAQVLAEARGDTLQAIEEGTDQNAAQIYQLPSA